MKANEIEIYPDGGEVVIAQENGSGRTVDIGQQFIRLTPDQLDQVIQWLRESAVVALEQQGHGD